MKRFKLAASLFVSATLLSSATFAHLSLKGEAMPMVAAPYNWTGFYAGINAGAVNHTMNITDTEATSFNATLQQVSDPQFTGGLQVGYRRQLDLSMAASGVFGLEFSANFTNVTFNKQYGSPFALYLLNAKNELKNVLLLQLIGGIAADRTLLFLAAGLSWTNITGSVTNDDSVAFFNSFNVDKKALGTAVGAGVEYAFTDNISARVKVDVISSNNYTARNDTDNSFQISNSIVQGTLGVNYKFA